MVSEQLYDLTQNKYNRLLTSLILLLVFSSVAKQEGISRFATIIVSLGILTWVFKQLRPYKIILYAYCLLVTIVLVVWGIDQFGTPLSDTSSIFVSVGFLLVLGIPIYFIQKDLSHNNRITPDFIKGGVAVYLLCGLGWSSLYAIFYKLNPQAFNGVSPNNAGPDLLYFSFTTLTTVGYGDITPAIALSRIFANLEAVFGVMYPTIFIALLVSLYQTHNRREV